MTNKEYIAAIKWFYQTEDQEAENIYMRLSRKIKEEILISYLEYSK